MKSSLLILLSSLIVTFSFLESHENNEIVNKPVRIKKSNETDYQTLSELENNYVKDSAGNWVTFGGAWDDRFSGYNCYGYSIDRCEQNLVTGNYSSKYQIGYFSGLSVNHIGNGGCTQPQFICDITNSHPVFCHNSFLFQS